MIEIWKDIPGYEGLYQISSLGNIKSFKNLNKILKLSKSYGYLRIGLYKDLSRKNFRVHRLVALTFIPNPINKSYVNHINGIRDDNRVENLEWCTSQENIIHKFNILGYKGSAYGKFGKLHHKSKKVNQYNLQGDIVKTWDSLMDIYRELGLDVGAISKCCNGKLKSSGGFIWKFNNN